MSEPVARPEAAQFNRIQRWFHAVITHPGGVTAGADSAEAQRLLELGPGQLEKVITRSRALSAAERLAIYANAYYTRLIECLGDVFPMLKRALGDEAFNGFAFGYLQDYPSQSYTLNELGRRFPRYLEETRPAPDDERKSGSGSAGAAAEQPASVEAWPEFLIDLARFEWAIYEVFDGPGAEGQTLLGADDVLDLPPDRRPRARLVPVPCLQLLTTRFPVNDYYTAARRAKQDEAVPMPGPAESFVALTRREYIVRRYNLSRPEFELLGSIQAGASMGDAIQRAAAVTGDDLDTFAGNLTLWFRNWTAEGFFQAIELPA